MRRAFLATVLTLGLAAPAQADFSLSGPAEVGETGGVAEYTVTRDGLAFGAATVTVSVSGAAGPPSAGKLTFGSGAGTQKFTVPVDDAADQSGQRRQMTVAITDDAALESVSGSPVTTGITDDDTTIDISAAGTVPEGGTLVLSFTPRRGAGHALRLDYVTAPGSAGAGDFAAAAGTLTWPAGNADAQTVTLATAQDEIDEEDESFSLGLSAPGTPLSPGSVNVTIADDDAPPLVAAVAQRVREGTASQSTPVQVLVGLSRPSSRTVTVSYATRDGTAKAPADYGAALGRLVFAPGETMKTVPVFVRADKVAESEEAFTLAITDVQNGTAVGNTTITIADDDGGGALDALPKAGGDATPPRIKLTRPTYRRGLVRLTLTCPKAERSCRGVVSLFPTRGSTERRIGRTSFALAGGKSRRLTIRPNQAARRLLRRDRRVRFRAYAVARDAEDNTFTTSVTGTLRR